MIWVYDPHRQAAVGVELYWEILTDFNLNFHLRSPQPCQSLAIRACTQMHHQISSETM